MADSTCQRKGGNSSFIIQSQSFGSKLWCQRTELTSLLHKAENFQKKNDYNYWWLSFGSNLKMYYSYYRLFAETY